MRPLYAEAAAWWRKAAEQDNAPAQLNLGVMYQNGVGVTQDYVQAVQWYRKSAEQGDATAQLTLGEAYQDGAPCPLPQPEIESLQNLVRLCA